MTRQQHAIRAARIEQGKIKAARMAAYQAALHPPRQAVTQDEFDQIVADAVYRNRESSSPQTILRWAQKNYMILEKKQP